MSKIISFLNVPGANEAQVMSLFLKLRNFIKQIEFSITDLRIYTRPQLAINEMETERDVTTLIVGWAVSELPNWSKWNKIILRSQKVSQFIPLDLTDRHGAVGRATRAATDNTGDWNSKAQRTKLLLFLKGHYLNSWAPYGLRISPKVGPLKIKQPYRSCNKLEPGPPDEIDIVRLIFRLFVEHDYCFAEISNLLNSQKIKPPLNRITWSARNSKAILQSAVYIGSNRFRGCIKHDAFPALIDRSVFFKAQEKISRNAVSLVQFLPYI
jgi:hypothetical protein